MKLLTAENKSVVPACPPFISLITNAACQDVYKTLVTFDHHHYDRALCVVRDVRRVPLKPPGVDEEEINHLALSSDGMRFFHPLTLHEHNCQSSDGFMAVLAKLNEMRPFLSDADSYSVINVDVSLYNTLSHIVYGFEGMSPVRRNVFMLLGIWHAYLYGHLAIWDRFRAFYLADAFFRLFPHSSLMRKPSLFKSSVFFTWLRVSYPSFRDEMVQTVQQLKREYLQLDMSTPRDETKITESRARFIHSVNLSTLFEFVLPVLQDYGTVIKLNSYDLS